MKQPVYLLLFFFLLVSLPATFAIKPVPSVSEKTEILSAGERTKASRKQQRQLRRAERKAERRAIIVAKWEKRIDRMAAKAAKKGKSLQSILENKLFFWGLILVLAAVVLSILFGIVGVPGGLWGLTSLLWLAGLVLIIIGIIQYAG